MPITATSGINIYWTRRGSGSPVLLIMGLSFTHEMWFRLTPALLGAGYETLLFDNRGMGRSETPRGPYRIRDMAKDAVAVLDAAGIQSAHIIGASMGGMIAQELALFYPERVKTLMLGCTSCRGLGTWPKWSYAPSVRSSWASRMERERAFRRILYADTTPDERIEEDLLVRSKCSWTYNGFWNQLAGILMWSSFRRLPRIDVPTLIIHGDQDRLIPSRHGRVLASRIPRAHFELIKDAGHILSTDQPEVCCRLMLDFLLYCGDGANRHG